MDGRRSAEVGLQIGNLSRHCQEGQFEQLGVDSCKSLDLPLGQRPFHGRGEDGPDFLVLLAVHILCIPRINPWRKSEFSESGSSFSPMPLQVSEVLPAVKIHW